MRKGTHVLVEQPDKVRFTGTVHRTPMLEPNALLGVVTDVDGQDRIVPHGSKVSRLHTYDDGEIRYVYTCDGDGRVWEIIERRWALNNEPAPLEELKGMDMGVLDEEGLTDLIREEDEAEQWEGRYPRPDLSRLGEEL